MTANIKAYDRNRGTRAGVIVLVLFLFFFALPAGMAGASEHSFGDINSDGLVNVTDVVLAMRHALGLETLTTEQMELADVNYDGVVNVMAVAYIMQYALDLIDEFPAEEAPTDTLIMVEPNVQVINGQNWLPEETVTIAVNGDQFSVATDTDGNFEMSPVTHPGLEVARGQVVTATDGVTTKVHFVRDLFVTEVDADEDTVSGTAPAGSIVEVRVYDMEQDFEDMPLRVVEADAQGNWTADFSEAEGADPSESAFDIEPGVTGEARITDLTNDATFVFWHVAETAFEVYPVDGLIRGFDWAPNADITITVGVDEIELTSDAHGFFDTGVLAAVLSAGVTVEVTDGVTTKTHIVTALEVTTANWAAGLVAGTAEVGSTVFVQLLEPMEGQPGPPTIVDEASVIADLNGDWSVDFGGVIEDNIIIYVFQVDEDGDRTSVINMTF